MRLLFVHGAGGYTDDLPLSEALSDGLGAELDYPRLPEEDMSLEAWAAPVRASLAALGDQDAVVGHSFGGTALLHLLETVPTPAHVALLAVPDWGPAGWDVAEYVTGAPTSTGPLSLHHCRDDEGVPFEHLALLTARLPRARVHEYPCGGHQLTGLADTLAHQISPGRATGTALEETP